MCSPKCGRGVTRTVRHGDKLLCNKPYKNLTFPHKAKIFEVFLPKDAQLPKTDPPYSSSIFLKGPSRLFPSSLTFLVFILTSGLMRPLLASCHFSPLVRNQPFLIIVSLLQRICMISLSNFIQREISNTLLFYCTCLFINKKTYSLSPCRRWINKAMLSQSYNEHP